MQIECNGFNTPTLRSIADIIKNYNVQTILEYGSGGTTHFFSQRVKRVYTVENDPRWIQEGLPNVVTLQMTYREFHTVAGQMKDKIDLVLIDCKKAARIAVYESVKTLDWKVLLVHDWCRDYKMYDESIYSDLKYKNIGNLRAYFRQ